MGRSQLATWVIRFFAGIFAIMLLGAIIFPNTKLFGYAFKTVDTGQVGVEVKRGEFIGVVGPGSYTEPFNWNSDIITVNTHAITFTAEDPEVLTKDLQRIGVTVSGDLFRPGLGELNEDLWEQYRPYYDSREESADQALLALVSNMAKQAMKVCVGERTFEQAAVGEQRNDLFVCIDEQLSSLMSEYGIEVKNVVVPNIAISTTMQAQLDALTESSNQILVERQNEALAAATGARQLAQAQQQIIVEQGILQETIRQQTITQALEAQLALAKRDAIQANIDNAILEANGDLDVAEIDVQVAQQAAMSDLADEDVLATIISEHPEYADYLVGLAMAAALGETELVVVPAGTDPNLIFGDSVVPTIDVEEPAE